MAATESKPTGGLRERKKAKQRKSIMDTTVSLCRERGYENTTLEEIVRIVEISQPTFYNYFASKDAVLREFARELMTPDPRIVPEESDPAESAADKLRRHYEGVSAWMESDQTLFRAIVLADGFNGAKAPEQQEMAASGARPLERIIEEGQESGEFTKDFPAERLTKNLEAVQGLTCLHWGEQAQPSFSLKERLAEGLEFFLRAARP